MFRDCIDPAIYSKSWATMDTASELGVRVTSFRAIVHFKQFFLIDCGIALKKAPLTPGSNAVSFVADESE